tara:strand:+ start:24 stop:542 length:519 start_codon:yes stop_codon:yes gene_type:complete
MKIDLNKTISIIILIMGHILFFLNIANQPSLAFIMIIGMFFVWILWNKVAGSFVLNHLIYLIALSGFIIAVSILLFYGIEPVGTRNGTLMRFHAMYIAFSMAAFFCTLLPYIILNMKIQLPMQKLKVQLKPIFNQKRASQKNNQDQYILDDENWEIISENEALSGSYYIDQI